MLFASFDFLLFFVVAFTGYWALRGRPGLRSVWIIATSYFFYMAAAKPVSGPLPTPWYFVGLLIWTTLLDYSCALRIAAAQAKSESPTAGRPWVVVALLGNLGLLGYFKYTGFLGEVIDDTAQLFGADVGFPVLKLLLPVGISFYTFVSLSYTLDVYRRRIPVERNFLNFAFFVAFFPHLVAGPIIRASAFLPQLKTRPALTRDDVDFAIWRIGKGLVKKVLLGDFIAASFADQVFATPNAYSSVENLLALYAFTLQIYADFSGYSDVAIGVARLLGFRFPENFNRPYQAVDVADFWRRWHMTLSTWLRDYVYYPLGGSKLGEARTYVNLWVTMFLVGIWHGASWNFVIYALIQACAMVFNRFCRRRSGWRAAEIAGLFAVCMLIGLGVTLLGAAGLRLDNPWLFGAVGGLLALFIGLLPKVDELPALRPVHVLLTVHFSVLSRVFFRADSLESARAMAGKLVSFDGFGVRDGLFRIEGLAAWLERVPWLAWARPLAEQGILLLLIAGFAVHYTSSPNVERLAQRWVPRMPAAVVGAGLAILMGGLGLLLAGPRANIYFAF
jgi:D-alanyl-lipoteichoic acid acyltransferase DltB (MBOAT superfamily)